MIQKTNPPEPFGYFRAEPFGWTDCAETDECAQPLYEQCTVDALLNQRADLIYALWAARQRVEIDRAALFQCHLNFSTNTVTDELGLAGLAEYDAVIEAIDAAIDGAQE